VADDGWCTLEDVRRALRTANLPGDIDQDNRIAVDAIVAQTEPVEKTLDRYWYADPGDDIVSEATDVTIPQSTTSRDDEHDIPTHAGYVDGAYGSDPYRATNTSNTVFDSQQTAAPDPKKQIRLSTGDLSDDTIPAYFRVTLERKDVDAVNELNIANADGGFDDWVASNDYSGGVGFDSHAGEDFYVRINSGGVSELYIDVHALDDDIAYLPNGILVDFDYGHEGVPRNVRRGIASLAAAELVEEAVIEIPQNATIYNIETKADELREMASGYLSVYLPDGEDFEL